jgi:peroxin-12
MFFVERHYLKHWSARPLNALLIEHSQPALLTGTTFSFKGSSFAENFYGLKRRRRPGVASEGAPAAVDMFTNHQRLGKREIRLSLFFLVGLPYLKAKAQDYYERIGGGVDSNLFSDSPAAQRRASEAVNLVN